MKPSMKTTNRLTILVILIILPFIGHSQTINTNYFIKNASDRHFLNPALAPMHGYFGIPALGSLGIGVQSDLGVSNFLFPLSGSDKLGTFLHPDVSGDDFLSKLDSKNKMLIDFSTPILSFGWFTDKGSFWSADISINFDVDATIPYEFFEFAKMGMTSNKTIYEIENMNISQSSKIQASLGYSRQINDKLRVGAKFKVLASIEEIDMNIERLNIEMNEEAWKINSQAMVSIMGNQIAFVEDEDGNVQTIEIDPIGVAGIGGAIDLGATYSFKDFPFFGDIPIVGDLLDGLTASASIVDLGFISYADANIKTATTAGEVEFTGFNDIDIGNLDIGTEMESLQEDLFGMLALKETADAKGGLKMLSAKFYLGAEFAFLNDNMSFGLLYSGRIGKYKYDNELTISYNLRPSDWFAVSASYSMLNVQNSIGWALHLTPPFGINFFIGSDYTYLTYIPSYYLPVESAYFNLQLGISIPIQGFKMRNFRREKFDYNQ